MKDFITNLNETKIENGQVGVFFLGQAGFLLKTHKEKLIAIDPYFSNCCERFFGFKRLMPYILDAEELYLDYLIISHGHYDHFDPDSVPTLMKNGKTELIGALDTQIECEKININKNVTYIAAGDIIKREEIIVRGMPCDHGELAPDALGLLIEIEDKKIYYMGDTSYRPDLLNNPLLKNIDLLILPINGAFGNLNEEEAAKTINILKPQISVPCHFWNFAEHGGNPMEFMKAMKVITPESDYLLMRQGENIILK
jgi:L-ascorbate 6-phosphate lactonase